MELFYRNSLEIDEMLDEDVIKTFEATISRLRNRFGVCEAKRSDYEDALYRAIGAVYAFAVLMEPKRQLLRERAKMNGISLNVRSNIFAVCAKMLFLQDRQKVSKYSCAMNEARLSGVEPNEESFTEFLKSVGGIEKAATLYRKRQAGSNSARPEKGSVGVEHLKSRLIDDLKDPSLVDRLKSTPNGVALALLVKDGEGRCGLYPDLHVDDAIVKKILRDINSAFRR